jgi:hypothetical protein
VELDHLAGQLVGPHQGVGFGGDDPDLDPVETGLPSREHWRAVVDEAIEDRAEEGGRPHPSSWVAFQPSTDGGECRAKEDVDLAQLDDLVVVDVARRLRRRRRRGASLDHGKESYPEPSRGTAYRLNRVTVDRR